MLLDFLFGRFRRNLERVAPKNSAIARKEFPDIDTPEPGTTNSESGTRNREDLDNPFPDVVKIEFRDVIDLHTIPPRQVRAVVEDYIEEAHRRGASCLRIIHGKGIGVQREIVRSILQRASYVIDFRDAPAESGGWGATLVTLRVEDQRD